MADPERNPVAASPVLEIVALLANPATSYWLKDAIGSALGRDPFDAERDALVLASLLSRHVDEMVARHFSSPGRDEIKAPATDRRRGPDASQNGTSSSKSRSD